MPSRAPLGDPDHLVRTVDGPTGHYEIYMIPSDSEHAYFVVQVVHGSTEVFRKKSLGPKRTLQRVGRLASVCAMEGAVRWFREEPYAVFGRRRWARTWDALFEPYEPPARGRHADSLPARLARGRERFEARWAAIQGEDPTDDDLPPGDYGDDLEDPFA